MNTYEIIGAISASILVLIQFVAHFPRIRRTMRGFIPWLEKSRQNYKEWKYWRTNKPVCRVVSSSPLYIKAIDEYRYDLEVNVTIEFTIQDDYSLEILMGDHWLFMNIENSEGGISPKSYKLIPKNTENIIIPYGTCESKTDTIKFNRIVYGKKPSFPNNPKFIITINGVRHPDIIGVHSIKVGYDKLTVEWLVSN